MFQDPQFQSLKRVLYPTSNHVDIERINIPEILNQYVHIYHGHSILRDDSFLMLAISIIIRKKMKKLKLDILETRNSMFESKIQTENQVKVRKQHKPRREQIVVDNQLIKLPDYFSQNQSRIAEQASIQLPNSQQQSNHSQDFLKMEVEEAPQQIFVPDYRELLKNQTKLLTNEQQQENQKTEVKQNGLNLYYQQLMDQFHVEEEDYPVDVKKAKNKSNTYRKQRPKVDLDMEINQVAYRSQFNLQFDQDVNYLLDKLQDYLMTDFMIKQQDSLEKRDSMFTIIKNLLDDESFQNQLLHFHYLDQSESSKSNGSVKSILKSKNKSEDSKGMKQIQFAVEEQQGLAEIQEEVSRQFNTSWSLFQEKSSYDKALQFYHTLCDAKNFPNLRITQQNTEIFGPISQEFYYDLFKILSQMCANQTISVVEKENIKNIFINHNSKLVQTIDSIYKTNDEDKVEKIISEIKYYVRTTRSKKPRYLQNKQMRIITDEYDKNQIEMDNVIIESDNESSP